MKHVHRERACENHGEYRQMEWISKSGDLYEELTLKYSKSFQNYGQTLVCFVKEQQSTVDNLLF